jgi:hypothetical protein
MIDSDQHPDSNRCPLTSSSQIMTNLRLFLDQRPSQILRSMTDLMLSNQHPFQSEDLYVLLPCHILDVGQVYTSSTFRLL